jgi:Flp pilus assembly protein TadG
VLLPFLAFVVVAAVDYGRISYAYQTVINSARNGGVYGSSSTSHSTDTTGIQNAALADASNLTPAPTVTSTTGTGSDGNPYVQVTVTYAFNTITNFPGIPSTTNLKHTVQMRVAPVP